MPVPRAVCDLREQDKLQETLPSVTRFKQPISQHATCVATKLRDELQEKLPREQRLKAGLCSYTVLLRGQWRLKIHFVCCSIRLQEKVVIKCCMKHLLMETARQRESHFIPQRKVLCKALKIN